MKYVKLKEAIERAGKTKTSDILNGICNYVGASEKGVTEAVAPVVGLWEKSEKENKPIFCNWRGLVDSRFENWIVKSIAQKKGGISMWFTYTGDIFLKDNSEKIILEKIKMFVKKGENVKKPIHLCFSLKNKEKKLLSEIITQYGIKLVEYHLRMRKKVGLSNENIIDLGQIFKELFCFSSKSNIEKFSNGSEMPKKEWYYPILMILSSKLIFLEDFEVCDSEMKKLVEKSYMQAVSMGFNPNFIRLKAEKILDWYMTEPAPQGVPTEIEKIIEEIINNINDP